MKIYAMSDIHGCLQSFDEALRLVDLSGDTIFVHAGVDEEADDFTFTEKCPVQTGKFCMNIVAGHIGTEA